MKSFNFAVVLRLSEGQAGSEMNYVVVPFAGDVEWTKHTDAVNPIVVNLKEIMF